MCTCSGSRIYNLPMAFDSIQLPSLLVDIKEGVIDLGWGHPSPSLHPLHDIRIAADSMFQSGDNAPLQYGATQGYGPFLKSLAQFLSDQPAYSQKVSPLGLFLTAGASQGIDLACTLFARAGDTVFVEEPTYFVIEKIFREHHLNIVGIPTDSDGLMISKIREVLESGVRPRFLYTIPTYQNPTGVTLSTDRRIALVDLAETFGFYVFADEVYQLIHFSELPPPPLLTFDNHSRVISFGSFSKILAPGLRTGWIQADQSLIPRFSDAALTFSGGGFNHFTSAIVREVIDLGLLEKNIRQLRSVYLSRSKTMDGILRKELGDDVTFRKPSGGYYYWLEFPEDFDTEKFLPIAEKHGVSFRPGNAFSESGRFSRNLRLTFTLYESEKIVQGVQRLGSAYRKFQ